MVQNIDNWRAKQGLFARLNVHIRPWMASHGVSWVSSTHVRFANLDFIVTIEEELMQAPVVIQPLYSTILNTIAKTLEELQLHALEARTPGSD